MQTRYIFILRFVLLISDIFLINISFFLSFYAVFGFEISPFTGPYKDFLLVCNIIWFFSSNICGLYRNEALSHIVDIYRASWRAIAFHAIFFIFYLTFSGSPDISRAFLLALYSSMSVWFLLSRFFGTLLEVVLFKKFKINRPVAVLGKNYTGLRLAGYLQKSQNFKFEGFLHNDEDTLLVKEDGSVLASTSKHLADAASRGIKDVYVSLSPERMEDVKFLVEEAERQCVRLKFVPDLSSSMTGPFSVSYMGEFPVISMRHEPLEATQNRFQKRFFDLFVSSLVIIFIMSWLVPIIGIIIKSQSRGPIFFKQLRSGRNNVPFWCYKFRSMRMNDDSDHKQASRDDDRITPIGRFIRKTSLDEFPQFFNVLLGNMSIIGPRPHMLKHTEQYRVIIDRYMVRHFLKPGISGWAQVNGLRGETEDPKMMEKRVEHDIWYMQNWSVMLDIKIIFMTVINVFRGEENAF